MPYPSKGAWRFRNITQGYDFWPTLSSVEIVDAHPHDMATLSFEVVDPTDTLDFQPEDRIWVTYDDTRIFGGHVKTRTRKQLSEMGTRVFAITCQDFTAKLDDSVITRKRDRPQESIRKRLRWIHENLNFNVTLDIDGVPAGATTPAANYHGMTTLEAFEQLADEEALYMQMDFAVVNEIPTLSFFRTITDVASFDLDDDTADYSTTFPYQEFEDTDDSSQLATMVYVIPERENEATWVIDETQRAIYGYQQSSVSDSSIKGRNGAIRIGGRFLDEFDQPLTEGQCVVWEPGLRSGQRVNIKNATWGLDYVRYITEVVTTAVEPHDPSGTAYLRSDIRFNDRRKTRRRPGRPGRGDTTVPTEEPLIDWPEDVASPGITTGDSLGHWGYQYRLTWGQESYLHEDQVYLEPGPEIAPVWTQHALWWSNKSVRSIAGTMNVHHADTPSAWACGLGLGSSGGWREDEWWTVLIAPLPTAPANVAGIYVTITLSDLVGAATGGIVYVRGSAPTVGRSGTVVATIGAGSTEVLIPYSAVQGSEVWIGVGPAWQADYHFETATHGLGDEGACVGGYTSGNGTLRVSAISAAAWAVYDSTPPDFGSTTVLDDGDDGNNAPWAGGDTIEDAGTEGSPTASGVSDGAFYVTGAGGRCVMVRGQGENNDAGWGVWSDIDGWSYQFPFEADILASGGEIEVTTTREGMTTVGTIYLDSTPSVKVAVPGASAEVTFGYGAGERWMARFDDRSGYFRAKVWEQSDGEPTDWTVSIALPEETDDVGDRVVLCVRAGTSQTVQVFPVTARAAAPATWIRERLGIAPGTTDEFLLSHQHVTGTLWFDIGGSFVPAAREVSGTGWVDYLPTPGMVVWANYLSD